MSAVIAGAAIAFVVLAALLIGGALWLGWWVRGALPKSLSGPIFDYAPTTTKPTGPVKLRAVGDEK